MYGEEETEYDQFTEDEDSTIHTSKSYTGERGSNVLREWNTQIQLEEEKKKLFPRLLHSINVIFSINPILFYFFSILNLLSGIFFFILIWVKKKKKIKH